MAKMIGPWTNRTNPVLTNTGMDYLDKYKVIICTAGQTARKSSGMFASLDKNYKFIDTSYYAKNRLFKPFNIMYNATISDLRFSADKTYAVMLRVNDLLFFKKDTDSRYYPLEPTITGALGGSYMCDISPDGQYAVNFSATSPYLQFYKRTGDTWAALPTISAPVTPTNGVGTLGRIFNNNNLAYVGNNGSNGNIIQVFAYSSGAGTFVAQTTTGIPTVASSSNAPSLAIYSNNYFVTAGINVPRLRFYKTSDGLNFTDLSANISSVLGYQYYNATWDPSGTYLFANLNGTGVANTPFCMYKRAGDTLTLLSGAFDVQPINSIVTNRNSVTWSNDSKFLSIAGGNSLTDTSYGIWLYKRDGDSFTKVGGYDMPMGGAWTTGTTPDFDYQNTFSGAVNKIFWL